jgi:hypothetical protein
MVHIILNAIAAVDIVDVIPAANDPSADWTMINVALVCRALKFDHSRGVDVGMNGILVEGSMAVSVKP